MIVSLLLRFGTAANFSFAEMCCVCGVKSHRGLLTFLFLVLLWISPLYLRVNQLSVDESSLTALSLHTNQSKSGQCDGEPSAAG